MRPTQLTAKIKIGSFDTGKQADITILDAKNIDYPLYFFATNLTHQVLQGRKTGRRSKEELSRLSKTNRIFRLSLVTGRVF